MNSSIRIAIGFAFLPFAIQAVTVEWGGLNLPVPDDDPSGLANQQLVNLSTPTRLFDVNVRLELTGIDGDGFNGDLYAVLTHGSAFSVLLNRPGRDIGNPGGYADNGVRLVLDDSTLRDIHTYRAQFGGPFPLPSALGGVWEPDGRETDPDNVVSGDLRTARLDAFNDLDPNGTWTLFIADLSGGGQVRLESWGLELITAPDSSVPFGWVAVAMVVWVEVRRRQRGPCE